MERVGLRLSEDERVSYAVSVHVLEGVFVSSTVMVNEEDRELDIVRDGGL